MTHVMHRGTNPRALAFTEISFACSVMRTLDVELSSAGFSDSRKTVQYGICGGAFGLIVAFHHGNSVAEEIGAALPLMLDTFLSRLAVDRRQRVKGAASCSV